MTVQRLAVAALLHDIGKFWSRTSQAPPYTGQEKDHFGTYAHALWTGHFLERHLGDPELAAWARMHHAPDSRESFLLSLADWLSSSERQEDALEERDVPANAALRSIVSTLGASGEDSGASPGWALPMRPHGEFHEGFFPEQGIQAGTADYDRLWASFMEQVEAIDASKAPLTTWMALMRKYTSRIPSATPTRYKGFVPDISLYDHSRTVAALASCFEADGMSESRASELRTALAVRGTAPEALNEPLCRLACGNLSGIQDFLYTLASKHAAKSLRGRSFALQIIADAAASYLCSTAGVPDCTIIYCSGGRFYVLLPLMASLDEARRHLARSVHDQFQGRLSVNVGVETLTAADFGGKAFADAWQRAGRAANAGKMQRYTDLARENYDAVFGFLDEGGSGERCAVCVRNEASGSGEEARCPECDQYEDWGQTLPHARYVVRTTPAGAHGQGLDRLFFKLGMGFRLVCGPAEMPPREAIREVIELNNFDPRQTVAALEPPAAAGLNELARSYLYWGSAMSATR